MSRYRGAGKRQRENERARKKREKAERRRAKRLEGPSEVETVTAASLLGDMPTPEEAMAAMQARRDAPRATIPARLFVGSLSRDTTTEDLERLFGEFGELSDCVVIRDRGTGESRGFGFVTFADRKVAATAIDRLDGAEVDGRRIRVNIATDR